MEYPIDAVSALDSVFGYIPKGSTYRLGKRSSSSPEHGEKKRSLMSLVVESITTDKDRLAAQKPKEKVVEVDEGPPKKNTDQDWEALQAEVKEMIATTTQLNESYKLQDKDSPVDGADIHAKIFRRREELFSLMYTLQPSHEKRDTLALLHQLKDIDDKDIIGSMINAVDLQMRLTNSTVIEPKFIHSDEDLVEVLTADLTPPDGCADNFWMAYKMAFIPKEEQLFKEPAPKETAKVIPKTPKEVVKPVPEFTKPRLPRRAPSKPTHLFYKSKSATLL